MGIVLFAGDRARSLILDRRREGGRWRMFEIETSGW